MHRFILEKVGKFSLYNISLKNISEGTHTYEYDLGRSFFDAIGGEEVGKGNLKVKVDLNVRSESSSFELNFDINGEVKVPCTRCLDDMSLAVEIKPRLIVKFGEEYSEESDEIVIIPEYVGEINIAWFLYEFIALAIPIKHVHPPGECNRVVSSKYRKHRAVSIDDGEDEDNSFGDEETDSEDIDEAGSADSRWDALKELDFESN